MHIDDNDPTHGLCSAMATAFNIHPLELESEGDLTHTQPAHVKKTRAHEQFMKQQRQQKEKVAWIKSTDGYKFANDGTRAVFISYVSN
jgi:hypothetical protein